jgi:hypothetical protein
MKHAPRSPRAGRRLHLESLEPRVVLSATDLRITELVASNEDGIVDADGDNSDWLEIYNSGSTSVDLSGMYLTDDDEELDKWTFPAGVVIPAGGYRIVFASDKDGVLAGGELHTNFKLSADGEYLALVAANGVTVIDSYTPEFPQQVEDVSYGRTMAPLGSSAPLVADGAVARGLVPTSSIYDANWMQPGFNDELNFPLTGPTGFGYENSPGDLINYTAEIRTTVPNTTRTLYLRIEFDQSTVAGIDQLLLNMRYDDGFVAYINGQWVAEANAPESIQWNSAASGIHDDALSEQWQSFDVSAIIPKLVVGQNVLAIHALNSPGSDMLVSPELIARGAVLVTPEQKGYFDVPTPGYGNGTSFLGFVDKPTFSVPHGIYQTPQLVSLSTPEPGAVIVYTTNGSTPAVNASLTPTNGTLYTGPINVASTTTLRAMAFKAGFKPSFIAASTYIFLNDVVNQSPTGTPPPGWPADGAANGQSINYGIDPDIIALYGVQAVKDSLASLPSISITTDLANLWNTSTGIYANAVNDGREWERPASAELINPDGSEGFSVNAGLRIRGGYARNDFNPKHALRLYFRSEYGDGKLHYPLFGDEGADEFDVVDLRTESNYSWSAWGSRENSFTREVFSRDLQGELGEPYTRSRYYHLYLDGQYFGVYQTQERVQEDYGETYLGGDAEDYDVVKAGRMDGGGTQVAEGNDLAWSRLFSLAQSMADNPAGNANNYYTMQGLLPNGTRNPELPVLLDVENLINFMTIIWYTGGFDTGISLFFGENEANNWYGIYNRENNDLGFQYFIHDNEHSLGDQEGGYHGTQFIDRTGPFNAGNESNYAYFNPVYLHQDLLVHPEYRMRIVEKVGQYFFNNGPMTPAASIARMQERIAQVEPAIIAEAARWGDSKRSTPFNKSDWQLETNWLLNTYFPTRTATVIGQLAADNLWIPMPTLSVPAGTVTPGTTLTMASSAAGTIYYTTDGSDPRMTNGGIRPSALVYSGPISLDASPTITARLRLASNNWSDDVSAAYQVFRPGDYQRNGVVDGGDFLAWQRLLGTPVTTAGEGADGNFSYWVDGGDLTVWQNNYGAGHDPEELAAVVVDLEAIDGAAAVSTDGDDSAIESFSLPKSVLLDLSGGHQARHTGDGRAARDAALNAEPEMGLGNATANPVGARDSARGFAPPRRLQFAGAADEAELALALDAALGELL